MKTLSIILCVGAIAIIILTMWLFAKEWHVLWTLFIAIDVLLWHLCLLAITNHRVRAIPTPTGNTFLEIFNQLLKSLYAFCFYGVYLLFWTLIVIIS